MKMYFARDIELSTSSTLIKRYMCVNCPHVEDIIVFIKDKIQFMS